jgi:hypothetical protein
MASPAATANARGRDVGGRSRFVLVLVLVLVHVLGAVLVLQ